MISPVRVPRPGLSRPALSCPAQARAAPPAPPRPLHLVSRCMAVCRPGKRSASVSPAPFHFSSFLWRRRSVPSQPSALSPQPSPSTLHPPPLTLHPPPLTLGTQPPPRTPHSSARPPSATLFIVPRRFVPRLASPRHATLRLAAPTHHQLVAAPPSLPSPPRRRPPR